MGMSKDRADEVAEAVAYWLFDQRNEILSDPEEFKEHLMKFLMECEEL